MIIMTPDVARESQQLRKTIWQTLEGHHPAAVADALMTLLAHVVARNARDPEMMAAALAHNLALAMDDDDDEPPPLPN
jgi:hypothetical protein